MRIILGVSGTGPGAQNCNLYIYTTICDRKSTSQRLSNLQLKKIFDRVHNISNNDAMLLNIFAVCSISLAVTNAFTIPDGALDGVYSVSTYPNGTEVHTRIGDPIVPAIKPRYMKSTFPKRQGYSFSDIACYSSDEGGPLNSGDTDAANSALQAQCGSGTNIGVDEDFYSISGCTVAYACNFDGNDDAECYSAESVAANQAITGSCGSYYPGSATSNENYNADLSYGYENYCTSRGGNFCGRGTSGKV